MISDEVSLSGEVDEDVSLIEVLLGEKNLTAFSRFI